MKFETMEECEAYFEDSELDCQFAKRKSGGDYKSKNRGRTMYICSKHKIWEKRREHEKRQQRNGYYFDCPAR